MRWIFAFFLFASAYAEDFAFKGTHFIASYSECDDTALRDVKALTIAMEKAVQACGAQILDSSCYIFPPDGMTMVFLLSESHASIHTYPEHKACFVDLFTCGDHCSFEKFDAALQEYLQPKVVNQKIMDRHQGIDVIQ